MGLQDHYVASIKGSLLTQIKEAQIVDISHLIKPWDLFQASFVVRNCFLDFPKGTIHIIGVDTELIDDRMHICALYKGHYFIGADNGIFSLIFESEPEKMVELTLSPDSTTSTFPTRDIFVKAASHISRGGTLEVIGTIRNTYKQVIIGIPATDENTIMGKVIYIDNYGNVLCNITQNIFKNIAKGRGFEILRGRDMYEFDRVHTSYHDVEQGEVLIIFNSLGYLEIAMNRGNAASLLLMKVGDQIRINFKKHGQK